MSDEMTSGQKEWAEEVERRVESLNHLASQGERYSAFGCDRIGMLNRELMAIAKAGWSLHSVVPHVLPSRITTDHMSYFCIIAELRVGGG